MRKPALWAVRAARKALSYPRGWSGIDDTPAVAAIIERESPAAKLAEALRECEIAMNSHAVVAGGHPCCQYVQETLLPALASARDALDKYDSHVEVPGRESPAAALAEALRAALDCSYNHQDGWCHWSEAASAALTKYDKENL